MKNEKRHIKVTESIEHYEQLGYKLMHDYDGLYIVMGDANNSVRIYENGDVWNVDCVTGKLIRIR